jgi:uncharacterized lipoprotein YehR (DUF1307 family)
MKKGVKMSTVLALIAMVGAILNLTSCSEEEELTAQDVALKKSIVGKWKTYSVNGNLGITDNKEVITYNSDGTFTSTTFRNKKWESSDNYKYYLNGSSYIEVNSNYTVKAVISSISDDEIVYSDFANNKGFECQKLVSRKINADYSKEIIGLWEGVEMTGESTHGTSDHRWEYRADGSYTYYTKDAEGNWIADASNSGNEFYVDGDFLGTRWIRDGKENREWWDIEKCNDTEMVWSALRRNKSGKIFNTKMVLRKVSAF